MRESEIRIARRLARHFEAKFRAGEDPPDIYLRTKHGEVAVELSTLAQMVEGREGRLRPRRSDDEPPLRIAEALNRELGPLIPDDRFVLLTFRSPLAKPRRAEAAARRLVVGLAGCEDEGTVAKEATTAEGDVIKAVLCARDFPGRKKVVAAVSHRGVGYNVMDVTRQMLEHRIADKSEKCAKALEKGEVWLALQADYFFARPFNLQLVMARTRIENPFAKILLIDDDGSVATIHEKTDAHARGPRG